MARRRKRRYYYSTGRRSRSRYDDRFEPVGLDLAPETKRGIAIVVFLVAGLIATLSLLDLAGSLGVWTKDALLKLFGLAAYVTPLIFLGTSLSLFFGVRIIPGKSRTDEDVLIRTSMLRTYMGVALFVLSVTGVIHLQAIHAYNMTAKELISEGRGGGYIGALMSFPIFSIMGYPASIALFIALILIALLIAFDLSLHGVFQFLRRFLSRVAGGAQVAPAAILPKTDPPISSQDKVKINMMGSSGFAVSRMQPTQAQPRSEPVGSEDQDQGGILANVASQQAAKAVKVASVPDKFRKGKWKLPPTDLLDPTTTNVKSGNIEANVKIIKKTLQDFGITVEMGEVNVGPTVTQYTFRPAVGVKLANIISRADDLALALAAPTIRIEAPIPGKSLVGIEAPNPQPAIVRMRELVESDAFQKEESSLAFTLGRDVAGRPVFADLERMPHLLIAGASGMGKSVCLNAILTSFLYRNSPQELQMIIIDPKRVDLTLYSGIPHLLCPVVTDHKKAINALRWAVAQMDLRYQMLSDSGKRNIQEYNQSAEIPLPFNVIIVDELAQLMSIAKSEVETAIVRLAQMARAVGLHLILATQRPSVDVITGLIKANMTTRIAFGVASQVDSRTILDTAGAESLLGRGDMLYQTPDLPKPKRVQSPFISTNELHRILSFIRDQAGPIDYEEDILEKPSKSNLAGSAFEDDEADEDLINAAIEEIGRSRKASATLLQRRLKIGYARASRILDILEDRGLVGPGEGAKPREIYIDSSPGGEIE
ncbi:MAG: hypothetical protein A2722_03725 [Candidatus Doudnabacteria bacterium RIFCSPHIGHO2_01_FULL_50_11]|uniref:FtsK domain-containing protein n=1 Tax=Candidatus Doudnabacteria bacterium RIFCSPHIGHO2_01_FULL_50_11 TaxID=1817828 RepID=A0A1F5PJ63_9BACT|nr:MAG: hypothetical protein A2722_03725 [Candidatus Doudnabacteria bacterium RIFCSPHIGHO2_01_FULL_50_11]HLC44611.1 DNA translocase FtsK 4TM domain-containing protein [Patescibacteria group bacterium]